MKNILYGALIFNMILPAQITWAGSVDLYRVEIHQDVPRNGAIIVKPNNKLSGLRKTLPLTDPEKDVVLQLNPAIETSELIQEMYFTPNPGLETQRMILRNTIKLGRSPKIKKHELLLSEGGFEISDFNCQKFFNVSAPSSSTLMITVGKLESIFQCSGKVDGNPLSDLNPQFIGKRDFDQGDFNIYKSREKLEKLSASALNAFLEKYPERVLPENHPTTQYVQAIAENLVRVSDRPELKVNVHVVDADIMNAFALPSGDVVVFKGLIDAMPGEAALAGVLGHELAHVVANHGAKSVSRALAFNVGALALTVGAVIAAAFGVGSSDRSDRLKYWGLSALQAGGALFLLHKSRENEREADRLGSQYAWALGYPPAALGQAFKSMERRSDPNGSGPTTLEAISSSHPHFREREETSADLAAFFFPQQKQTLNMAERDRQFFVARNSLQAYSNQHGGEPMGLNVEVAQTFNQMITQVAQTAAGVN